MGFNVALTSPQYTQIRSSSYYGEYLVTFCKNTVIFAGQINSDLTTPLTWAQFAYNGVTVGAYTDVVVGQALLISTTNDITTATFRGRVRLIPTSSIVYCNESSQDFSVGNYFWVINAFDPTYRLSRPDANGNEQIDYDLLYQPDPAIAPTLRSAFVDYVDSVTGKMRIAFDVSDAYASASGATISSYLFKFKTSSYTVISGSLSTAIVTVDFNPGEQWGLLTITDSNGVAWDRHIYINAHNASNPPDSGFSALTISGNLQSGWTLSNTAFTGVNNVLNDTFAVVWRHNENYGGTAGSLTTNNIAFIGWVQRETDALTPDNTYSVLSDAQFQITGVLAQMNRLSAQLLAFSLNSSPSAWSQIANLTPWRGIIHFFAYYTTFLNLCGIDFDLKDTTYLFPEITTQGGNVQNVVTGIAAQVNANLETAPDGRIRVDTDATFLTNLGQAGLTTVATYQAQDCLSISKAIEQNNTYGIVDADGAAYNSSNGQVSAFTARAPGHAQGEAQGHATLPNQILVSNSDGALVDLRQRAGNEYNKINMSEVLTVGHFDGLSLLIPSRAQLFTFALDSSVPGTNGVARIVYTADVKWLLETVTYTLLPNGGMNVNAIYRRLPIIGDLGDDTTLVPENSILPAVVDPGLPAFNFELPDFTFPDFGIDPLITPIAPTLLAPPPLQVAWLDGRELVVFSVTNCYYLRNFIALTRPTSRDVTPSDLGSFGITGVAVSPEFTKTAIPCFLLANDTVHSRVWVTPNIAAVVPTWTATTSLTGIYTQIRAISNTQFAVYSASATSTVWTHTFDFVVSDGGWVVDPAVCGDGISADYTLGVGWKTHLCAGPNQSFLTLSKFATLPPITSVRAVYNITMSPAAQAEIDLYPSPYGTIPGSVGAQDATVSGVVSGSGGIRFVLAWVGGSGLVPATLTKIVVAGTGVDPF